MPKTKKTTPKIIQAMSTKPQTLPEYIDLIGRARDLAELENWLQREPEGVAVNRRLAEAKDQSFRTGKIRIPTQLLPSVGLLTQEIGANCSIGLRVGAVVILYVAVDDLLTAILYEIAAGLPDRVARLLGNRQVLLSDVMERTREQVQADHVLRWMHEAADSSVTAKLKMIYGFVRRPRSIPAFPTEKDAEELRMYRHHAAHGSGAALGAFNFGAALSKWSTAGPLLTLWVRENISGKFEAFPKGASTP